MYNNIKKIGLFVCLVLILNTIAAQELGFGFRAGWSYTSFNSPLLEGESNNYQSGIHIGPTIALKITDRFGLHSGLFYSQGGNEYKFKGAGFAVLINDKSRKIITGKVDKTLLIENTYIDIPLGAYFHLTDKIQVFGGINFSFLVSSSALGTFNFEGSQFPVKYQATLDHKYFKDQPGQGSESTVFGPIRIDGQAYTVPEFQGGYYFHESKSNDLYNIFDFGVHAGFRFFLNGALYLSTRVYYGLSDINNNDLDLSPVLKPDEPNKLQFQADKDNNISLQISLGFAF